MPGQLLARCGIEKTPSTSKPSRFDARHWDLVWREMFYLALRRCRFNRRLQPPKKCFAPLLPQAHVTKPAPQTKRPAPRLPSDGARGQVRNPLDQVPRTSAAEALRAALEAARHPIGVPRPSRALTSPLEQDLIKPTPDQKDETKRFTSASIGFNSSKLVPQEQPPRRDEPTYGVLTAAEHDHGLKPHPTRQFIEVPFEEKDDAKKLGARWDPVFKKWYVPTVLNRNLFRWPDALMPPEMCAVVFPPDKPSKAVKTRSRKKKNSSSGKSIVANKRLQKEIESRLQFLLDKPDKLDHPN